MDQFMFIIPAWRCFTHSRIRLARLDPRFRFWASASFVSSSRIRPTISLSIFRWRFGKSFANGTSKMVA
jgi:hypothetical protein